VNPHKNLQILSAMPIQEINYSTAIILAQMCYFRQYYWLGECSHLEEEERIKGVKWSKILTIRIGDAKGHLISK
jgi:hypothetical protein